MCSEEVRTRCNVTWHLYLFIYFVWLCLSREPGRPFAAAEDGERSPALKLDGVEKMDLPNGQSGVTTSAATVSEVRPRPQTHTHLFSSFSKHLYFTAGLSLCNADNFFCLLLAGVSLKICDTIQTLYAWYLHCINQSARNSTWILLMMQTNKKEN